MVLPGSQLEPGLRASVGIPPQGQEWRVLMRGYGKQLAHNTRTHTAILVPAQLQVNDRGIPGVKELAVPFNTYEDAQRVRGINVALGLPHSCVCTLL